MIQINPLLHEEESFTRRGGPLARRRVNLLLLLDAAEQADLTPLPSQQLHRMAFLANGLSPIYDVPIVDGEILKYRRGPFYSELQWDIDRLVFMGFAELSNIRHERDEHGWWFFADYALSAKGVGTVEQVIAAITSARERHAFYLEVAGAYSTLQQEGRDDAALEDANFRNEDALPDFVIDFSEPETNFSAQAADGFSRLAPPGVSLANRDKLYLYFRYLNRMVERAAG